MPSDYNDTGIATGAIANIQNGADAVPLSSWTIDVNPTLSGKSSVICRQTGVNLWNESWETGAISETTGANTVNNSKIRPTGLIAVTPSTSFYIVCPQLIQILFYRKDETYIGIGSGYGSSRVFTTDANTYYIRFNVANAYGNTYNNDISVNYPSTDTSYHAHTTQIVNTVSLGRTIYGGQADVVNGTGKSTHGKTTVYASDNWQTGYYGVGYRYYISGLSDMKKGQDCLNDMGITGVRFNIDNSQRINAYCGTTTGYDTVEKFKEALGNGVNLCYELATPEDFTFTPITPTPETALGVNNFWADEGDSELTYYKDGYGYTSVTVHKETPEGEPVEVARKFHRIIYEGQVDVISGTGLIYRGESGTEYDPPEEISFTPVEIATDEGENTFYADEGVSVITYRRGAE